MPITAITRTVIRAVSMPVFSSMSLISTSFKIFWDALEDAARSWESAVDMVAARMPARITPATRAASTPCLEIRSEIVMRMVSASSRAGMEPAFVMALPITPIKIATAMEITTQTEATLLDSFSFSASSMAIKRRSTWGIPKYPSPQASMEAIVKAP